MEGFDSGVGFTTTHPDRYTFANGELLYSVCRGDPQWLYRSIPEFSGNVRLTVRGRIDSYVNNMALVVGIGDEPYQGVGVSFEFTGGGCAVHGTYIWAQLNYISLTRDGLPPGAVPDSCSGWAWTYFDADLGTYYVVELVISGTDVLMSVPGQGTASGTTSYLGPYDTLYLGFVGGTHSYCNTGAIDWVQIDPMP